MIEHKYQNNQLPNELRKQKYHGSFPTKKAALEALANIQAQVNEGSYLEPSMEDFHVYIFHFQKISPIYGKVPRYESK